MKHGILMPSQKAGQVPARVVNVRSKKNKTNNPNIVIKSVKMYRILGLVFDSDI